MENPFNIDQKPVDFQPVLSVEQVTALRANLEHVDPVAAAAAVEAIGKATQEKRSAKEILDTVFSIVGGLAKVAKPL